MPTRLPLLPLRLRTTTVHAIQSTHALMHSLATASHLGLGHARMDTSGTCCGTLRSSVQVQLCFTPCVRAKSEERAARQDGSAGPRARRAPAAGDDKGMQPRWIAGPLRALLLRPAAAAAAGVASTATASAPAWAGFIGHLVLCLPPIPGHGIRLPRRPRAASKGPAF
jgi:hypothetical protein